MKKIYLKTGNEAALEIDLPFGTVDTQIEVGRVSEWFDIPATKEQLDYLELIVKNGDGIVRISGSKFNDERS